MAAESTGTGAAEQLAQLRFDLHDGPQQEVVLLAHDMQMLRGQLEGAVRGHASAPLLLGHLADLQARLVALAGDLGRLSTQLGLVVRDDRPFDVALRALTDEFAARTGVMPATALSGDLAATDETQRQAVLSVIREALNNVRKHSDAARVWITVGAQDGTIEATVRDDGAGFDPAETIPVAAADGRLGFVGMQQRMQMLGGFTRIDSRPGGPTLISASLPADPR